MGKWVAILTVIILIVVVFVFGQEFFMPSTTSQNSLDPAPEASLADGNKVVASHAYKDGIHRFSGVFKLPHTCFKVGQVGTVQNGRMVGQFTLTDLKGQTSPCLDIATRYPFTLLIEAAENTPIDFFIDGEQVPATIKMNDWSNPSGTYLDPSATLPGNPQL